MIDKNSNIGATLLTLQQQFNHQKKLEDIYLNKISKKHFTVNESLKYVRPNNPSSKRNQYQNEQHLKNVRRLFINLNRQKTMNDRLKDPFDFFAFPSYFFRQVPVANANTKKKLKSKLQKVRSQTHLNQKSSKISMEKIRQFLPLLTTFDRQQLQEFADGLNKLIITFNIVSREELLVLYQKIMSTLSSNCPSTFRKAVGMMMQEIGEQLSQ